MCVDLPDRLATDLDGAFEGVILAHQDLLYGIARRMLGNDQDAEEMAQDAFVRAYRALATYPPDRIRELRLRPWLARITVNLVRNRLKARTPVAVSDVSDLEAATSPEGRPEWTAERNEEALMWARLLAGLPPLYRLPLALRHVEGLSYPELAEALGRPVGTVKAQLHRGTRMLRVAYEAEREREDAAAGWQRSRGAA